MTDITVSTLSSRPSPAESKDSGGGPAYDLIELLFFAYRDFIGDADEILSRIGFGRAHHRVLHFVHRHPGMRVADLLDVLKITKQSLGRRPPRAGRQRLRRAAGGTGRSPPAPALPHREGRGARARTRAAADPAASRGRCNECGEGARAEACRFLTAMIEPSARGEVTALMARAEQARSKNENKPR